MTDLSKKRIRERLRRRREQFWQKIAERGHLGFRTTSKTWHARYYVPELEDYEEQPLHGIGPDDYEGALNAAQEWLAQMGGTAHVPTRATVRNAIERGYLEDLKRHGRESAAKTALTMFKRLVFKDPIANLALEDATRQAFEQWRDRQRAGRKPRSINRYVRQVMGALNRAHELGYVGDARAWALKPLTDDTEYETQVFLDASQRAALVKAASPHAALFFRGLELTGCRPGELAVAIVQNFDGKAIRFVHHKGKGGAKPRVRYTVLDQDGVAFFEARCAGRLPQALMFTQDGIAPWHRAAWAKAFRAAAVEVNKEARGAQRIPPDATPYAFRHSRISELLQVYGVDALSTAHQTGTSIAMLERAYLRFIPQAFTDKLANIKVKA